MHSLFGVLNALTLLAGLAGFAVMFARGGNFASFKYYTVESNAFAVLAAGIAFVLTFAGDVLPGWARLLYYAAVCTVAETFTVAVFVLSPADKEGLRAGIRRTFFSGSAVFQHLLCPLLSMASLIAGGLTAGFPFYVTFIALIPTLLYASVTLPLNIARKLHGPYPFLYVHEQSVMKSVMWCLLIPGMAYALACALWAAGRAL